MTFKPRKCTHCEKTEPHRNAWEMIYICFKGEEAHLCTPHCVNMWLLKRIDPEEYQNKIFYEMLYGNSLDITPKQEVTP